jgi:nucleoside triphosphatase
MNDAYAELPSGKDEVKWRIIVVGVIQNAEDEYLICRKPKNRGVFPGQWALPGGGIEPGEHMQDALRREIKEEVGIEIFDIRPLFFKDGQYSKLYPDGSREDVYMIFLVFTCRAGSKEVVIGDEFETFTWVSKEKLSGYDLNTETRGTFIQMGVLPRVEKGGS